MRPEDIETDEDPIYTADDAAYLIELGDRLMHVPVMYGVDQADAERLIAIGRQMQADNQ